MRIKSLFITAAAALARAACGSGDSAGAPKGEPIAKVAAPAGKAWTDVVTKTEAGGYVERSYGQQHPRVMLMNGWAERLELHDLVTKVAETCRRMKVDKLIIENKAAGHSVAQEMRRLFGHEDWGVQLIDPKGQDKLARL